MLSSFILQKTVYGALSVDTELLSLLGGPAIYDPVPDEVAFPYVSFGPALENQFDTATETVDRCRLTLNVWTRGSGKLEAARIAARIRDVFDENSPLSEEGTVVLLRVSSTDILQARDKRGYRAVLQLTALIQRNT